LLRRFCFVLFFEKSSRRDRVALASSLFSIEVLAIFKRKPLTLTLSPQVGRGDDGVDFFQKIKLRNFKI
jgi:hypothetical protein